jgi:60 kDa SS-A/Ro ribonucleoprotein
MANKNIFTSATPGKTPPQADTVNHAGGKAYSLTNKQALAQYAVTGTFNDTYYTKGADQPAKVLEICKGVDSEFIAKTALYARQSGRMKDMPAFLSAILTTRGEEGINLLKKIFPYVMSNGKMLRNFVQIMRSGAVGRKSLGSAPKKLVRAWFNQKSSDEIFRSSTGNDPSFADIIKMVHPAPESEEKRALFGYLASVEANKTRVVPRKDRTGAVREVTIKNYDPANLPALVKEYEDFKKAKLENKATEELPKVPWEMLEGLALTDKDWDKLARQASWTQVRMNLNTFARHGVLKNAATVKFLADKLSNKEDIDRVKPFPYQLFTAYRNIDTSTTPREIVNALHDAVEASTKNVTVFDGEIHIAVDVSASMGAPVTGHRVGATTKTSCCDVASLIACVILRKNNKATVYPFDTRVRTDIKLEPRDSIMTNATRVTNAMGGGTDCSKVLAMLNEKKATGDLVIYLSDTESWADNASLYFRSAGLQTEWEKYRARNPKAKLVCINLAVNDTSQVVTDKATLNIGGWSDAMFTVINDFVTGASNMDAWVSAIESMQLPEKA